MWGALVGVASLAGSMSQASSANRQAQEALAFQREQLNEQRRMADLNYGLAQQEAARLQEYDAYQREQNDWSRQWAEQNYSYNRDLLESNRDQQLRQYQYLQDRQAQLDASAAEQRAFEMEQFLKNQQLTEEQRDWVKSQYEEAKAQAIMQRNYGLDRQSRADALAGLERQFDLDQIYRAQSIAQSERQYEQDKQQNILSQIDALSSTLNNTVNGFGDLVPLKHYTRFDVDQEAQRRGDLYAQLIDRAADRVASVNEADAIRSGMSESTQNNRRRADITSQIAHEYQQAYGKGYDEAQQYIGNLQAMEQDNRNQLLSEQQQKLQQLMTQLDPLQLAGQQGELRTSAIGPQMQAQSAINNDINPFSVVGAYNGMNNVGSGVYTGVPGTGNMAGTINLGSGVYGDGLSTPGIQFNALSTPNPSAYMSNAASLIGAGNGLAETMYQSAINSQNAASQAFGNSMANLGDMNWGNIGSSFSSGLESMFGANKLSTTINGWML